MGGRVHADRRRQPRAQLTKPRIAVIEGYADRYALNVFREVAGGVFRRDHTEDRSGPRRKALDATAVTLPPA